MTQVNDIRVTLLWRLNSVQTITKDIRVIYQPGTRFPRYELNQARYDSLMHLENNYIDKIQGYMAAIEQQTYFKASLGSVSAIQTHLY